MRILRSFFLIFSVFFLMCEGCSDHENNTGGVVLRLTDAGTSDYQAVYVTIQEVQVYSAAEVAWKVVASPKRTYNLLELINGETVLLGSTEMNPGTYTKVRLIIGSFPQTGVTNILGNAHPYANYVIENDEDDTIHSLTVSSSTIDVDHDFSIAKVHNTELLLDFDVSKSVLKSDSTANWLLNPVVKVIDPLNSPVINGTVITEGSPIEGALISIQTYNSSTSAKDRVQVHASTITDENGNYQICLNPGTYYIAAYKDGYSFAYQSITVANNSYDNDFSPGSCTDGYIENHVDIASGTAEITISFRQLIESNTKEIEVKTLLLNVSSSTEGSKFKIALPVGKYNLIASKTGGATIEYAGTGEIEITATNDEDSPKHVDLSF